MTFLFSDLEGSTRLFEEHPAAMQSVIARHDELLRTAVESHGGYVVKFTGDGVHAAFASARAAADAAITAQHAIIAEPWADGLDVRIRMGLHAGEAVLRDGDYFGSEVNRAARIMSVAHGGQIVCSRAVTELLGDPDELIDLGAHRLRDLRSTVQLFQVTAPGLPIEFPPLRSLDAYPSNLPFELSSFIGRDDELRAVERLLKEARLVSVVGAGGVGKTRLALRVASEVLPHYRDGVWLVELAPVRDPDQVPEAIAEALRFVPAQGTSTAVGLVRYLEHKQLLLVIDNCEHLVGAVARFAASTLAAASQLTILATSREAVAVAGERTYPLGSLGTSSSSDVEAVTTSEAGALFALRAREARPDFAISADNATAVHDICRHLDGIALAIELAAARTAMMTPAEIAQRLDRQFRLLTGGSRTALERHQTLRATIDWSYDLLDDTERRLLDRCSVFVGGFDLDAVATVAEDLKLDDMAAVDTLGSLVAKSLVEHTERGGATRYRLLEMIRQYAAQRLDDSGDSSTIRDGHARHYLELGHHLFEQLHTPQWFDALDRLDTESANASAAFRWLLDRGDTPAVLEWFGQLRFTDPMVLPPSVTEELGRAAAEAVANESAPEQPGFVQTCHAAAMRAFLAGDTPAFQKLVEVARPGGGRAFSPMLTVEAAAALYEGDLDCALTAANQSVELARLTGDAAHLTYALCFLGLFATFTDPTAAVQNAEEAVALARAHDDALLLLLPLVTLANALRPIDPDRALQVADECIALDRTRRRSWGATARSVAAVVLFQQGQLTDGLAQQREVLAHFDNTGDRTQLSIQISSFADALATTDPAIAIDLGAVAESTAIAPYACFGSQPNLVELASTRPDELQAARAKVANWTYDDAMTHVYDTIDQLVAAHTPGGNP